MRKLFIAGNWKMNLDAAAAKELTTGLKDNLCDCTAAKVDVAVCPAYVYVPQVVEIAQGSPIAVGAQDVYFEGNGAFTGEVSVAMLKDVGCKYTILGHSERRHVIGETDELTNQKLLAALAGGLDVILCIGELLEERQANQTEAVIERHLRKGLAGVTKEQMAKVTIAYEPVWAIGTGQTATPEQAQEAHAFARSIIADMFDNNVAQETRIQYGGSVKPSNAAELLSLPDVDGALVGGASLKVQDFMGIINAGASTCGCGCQ
ncbi:MAG: triose-phosphate isomerase [Sedimentisphaerales bacterium]|nr:triose-phosphate isomerase [Sedimentisphaerales bacterium]